MYHADSAGVSASWENVIVRISSFCSLTSLSSKFWPVLSVFNF